MPKISVIMGIYNCENTLAEAIECILAQTYTDWELIMCDDGSSDNTLKVAQRYLEQYPEKIVVLKNDTNRGLNYTLNYCLSVTKGEYIARMDGDDKCLAERFEKEVNVLDEEPSIALVSTDMTCFDENGSWGFIRHPEYPVAKDFMKGSPFCHAPSMIRKVALDKVGGYSDSQWLLRVEDYHLWMKLYSYGYKGKNIHEPLYQMRDDINAYRRRKFRYRINEAYVKGLIVKKLRLPVYNYIFVFRPIVVGLLPNFLYDYMHKRKLKNRRER